MAKAPMNPLAGPSGPGDKFSKKQIINFRIYRIWRR
jgi:hypothetical protein